MSTDNRTIINDCDENAGWTGDDAATVNTDAGSRYQGIAALSTQLSNADEQMSTTEDSEADTTFSLDWSDSTLYMLIKDNLVQALADGGIQFVIGDAVDLIGYDIGGNDAPGMDLPFYYRCLKLDVSVIVATPGVFAVYAGAEADLDQAAITQIGYGTIHLAKAVGAVDNVFMDCFRYIANDAYALTVNGGTVGTPETMADVQGDDATNGWGIISNPLGKQYLFFAPTEWGESAPAADHYFEADGEQWFLMGDNAGGHAVGATHFPFRVVGNATDTGLWRVSNTSIVNTGTRAQLLLDDADIDTLEMDGCVLTGLGTISAPSAGGVSRFLTNTIFSDCEQITHNGADMSGSSVLVSAVAANEGALFYDEATDPDGETDNMAFSKGAASHHAIRFGTNVPTDITLRGIDFVGFGSSDDADDSIFRFDDTSGSITLNLVACTHDGSGFTVDDRAGVTVTVVIDPVTVAFEAVDKTDTAIANVLVTAYAIDDDSEIINDLTDGSGFATTSYSGSTPRDIYYRYRKSSSGAQKYDFVSGFATIEASTGATVKRNMVEDDIADPAI